MTQQVNPPFDGSTPCPGCQSDLRNVAALIHNFLTRCDIAERKVTHGKAMVKLYDLRSETIPDALTVPHPVTEELIAVAKALQAATQGMTQDGTTIRWTPEVTQQVEALIMRAAIVSDAYDKISDAHFSDNRHSNGGENILRAKKGSHWAGFVNPDYEKSRYDYGVHVVEAHGDMIHKVCDTQLRIDDHFKEIFAKDPSFYAKAWCPTCKINAPIDQFKMHHDASAQ